MEAASDLGKSHFINEIETTAEWVGLRRKQKVQKQTRKTNGETGPQMNTDFSVGCFLNILKGYDNHLEEAEINDEEETVPLGAK